MAKKSKQYDYDLSEVKRLIGETDKNYREIAAETGCPYASVVYHGRKIRGRVNRSHKFDILNEPAIPALQIRDESKIPLETTSVQDTENSEGTTLSISRSDILIEDAEREAAKMIKAAQALGLKKVNLTVEK